MEEYKTIVWLFQRYLDDNCTSDEIKILLQYFDAPENEVLLKSLIRKQLEENSRDTHAISHEETKYLLDKTFSNIKKTIASNNITNPVTVSLPLYRQIWFRLSAASVIIFFILSIAFFYLHPKNEIRFAQKENLNPPLKEIPPGRDNAVLTLDDGTTIMLDSAANGTLAQQGNIKILKIDGQITYNKPGLNNKEIKPVYNTVTTANGNQYQLILTDGSKVWLNAASSIRFPISFTGNERRVEITGEAYFEVAKDAKKPFRVEFNNRAGETGEIVVLGTHFNVDAYPDGQDVKTTLLEGSVKIKRADQVQMLSPGQQATLTSDTIILKKDIDTSQVIAWKDGFFVFNNANIQTIVRQLARWYDIEVDFEGKMPGDGYSGKVSRNVPLSKFLKVLELNDIHTRTERRKVTLIF